MTFFSLPYRGSWLGNQQSLSFVVEQAPYGIMPERRWFVKRPRTW